MLKNILILKFLILFSFSAVAEHTVCSITVNSTHERELFKKHYPYSKHIELVPAQVDGTIPTDWFSKACSSGVVCDILIISGHFGGTFMGSAPATLKIQELEKASCNKTCEGILRNPKEVYLFGCNTLAGKKQDSRTIEEYILALRAENLSPEEATRIAAIRYTPIGGSFSRKIENIFWGDSSIFGFNSIGPSGANVSSKLETYLESNNPNRFEAWMSSLALTARMYSRGSAKKDELTCSFLDNKSTLEKLKLIRDTFESKVFWDHIFTIETALHDISLLDLNAEELEVYSEISNNQNIKSSFIDMISKLNEVPVYKISIMKIALKFKWLKKKHIDDFVIGYFKEASRDGISTLEKDSICSMDYNIIIPTNLILKGKEDVLNRISALNCLGKQHSSIVIDLFEILKSETKVSFENNVSTYLNLMNLALISKAQSPIIVETFLSSFFLHNYKKEVSRLLATQTQLTPELEDIAIQMIPMLCAPNLKQNTFFGTNSANQHSRFSSVENDYGRFILNFSKLSEESKLFLEEIYRIDPNCVLIKNILNK